MAIRPLFMFWQKRVERIDKGAILFLGEKSQEQIVEILSITDIFVNPSYSEGLPTSVMEAAGIGLPIVATDVGGTRQIIEARKTGLLVACGDVDRLRQSICELIRDKNLRILPGENAHRFVKENYS